MKRIFNQLKKLYPNNYVSVGNGYVKYSFEKKTIKIYSVYINDIFNSYENEEMTSIKELDAMLCKKIPKYKSIYNE